MAKVKRVILAIAIAILFVMFVAYAIETFYPSPDYDDFCNVRAPYVEINNRTACEEARGEWSAYVKPIPVEEGERITEGWCDLYKSCNEEFDIARAKYNRNIFFITLIIGLLTVIVAVLLQLESVSAGFMAGGVILFIYGTIRYWGDLSDVWRTLMLGIALGVLVWIGYKKLK